MLRGRLLKKYKPWNRFRALGRRIASSMSESALVLYRLPRQSLRHSANPRGYVWGSGEPAGETRSLPSYLSLNRPFSTKVRP